MTLVVISAAGQRDVETILVDLALKAGSKTALEYLDLFEKLYNLFERYPTCGAPRRQLGRGVRIGRDVYCAARDAIFAAPERGDYSGYHCG